MKKLIFLAALSAGCLIAGLASAQDWYVRADAGGNINPEISSNNGFKADTGWMISGAAGREMGHNIRLEAEFQYQQADAKHNLPGKLRSYGGFANAYYDIPTGTPWVPFVGAGVGVANVKVADTTPAGDQTRFAYQVKAGVARNITDRLTGEVAYRYTGVPSLKLNNGSQIAGDYSAHAVMVGLRYRFGG